MLTGIADAPTTPGLRDFSRLRRRAGGSPHAEAAQDVLTPAFSLADDLSRERQRGCEAAVTRDFFHDAVDDDVHLVGRRQEWCEGWRHGCAHYEERLRHDGERALPEIGHVAGVAKECQGWQRAGNETTYCAVMFSNCLMAASRHLRQFSRTAGSKAACSLSKTAKMYGLKMMVLQA